MDGRCRHFSLENSDVILPALPPEWKTALSVAWSLYIAVLSIWIVMQKRAPVSTLGWILSMALLPYLGFAIYYFFGPQRLKKQRLKRLRSRAIAHAPADLALIRDRAQEAPHTLRQMSALGTAACGLPISSATGVQLLSGGAAAFDAIFEAVAAAQHREVRPRGRIQPLEAEMGGEEAGDARDLARAEIGVIEFHRCDPRPSVAITDVCRRGFASEDPAGHASSSGMTSRGQQRCPAVGPSPRPSLAR